MCYVRGTISEKGAQGNSARFRVKKGGMMTL